MWIGVENPSLTICQSYRDVFRSLDFEVLGLIGLLAYVVHIFHFRRTTPLGTIEPIITVRTSQSFESLALSLMARAEYDDLIDFLARNYLKGDIIPATGGVRKIRYARQGNGKSGGFRVIYYYHSEGTPLIPCTLFAKNRKTTLSGAE